VAEKIPRRIAVIRVMTKPKMPCEIHEQALGGVVSPSNTTEILGNLVEEGIAVCINRKERVGRLYALTRKGRSIRNKICGSRFNYHSLPKAILTDYVWVMRGKHRRVVIKVMDARKTPSQIHRDVVRSCENFRPDSINYVRLSLNSTSDTLRGFRKKGIAVCINKEERVGRLYELTEKGKAIREEILKE